MPCTEDPFSGGACLELSGNFPRVDQPLLFRQAEFGTIHALMKQFPSEKIFNYKNNLFVSYHYRYAQNYMQCFIDLSDSICSWNFYQGLFSRVDVWSDQIISFSFSQATLIVHEVQNKNIFKLMNKYKIMSGRVNKRH